VQSDYVYGIHVILNLLKRAPQRILEIRIIDTRTDNRLQEIISLSTQLGISLEYVNKKQLDSLLKDAVTQGVVARVRPKEKLTEFDLKDLLNESEDSHQVKNSSLIHKTPLFLILDGVQDPHNLGAVLRTADASGVRAIIIPKDRSVGLTAVVQKIASGAVESISLVEVTNLVRAIELLKKEGVWIIGMSDKASKTIYEMDLTGPVAIVLGSEGSGLRRLTEESCDFIAKIPMQGVVESLNVSVAAGISLYEALRQRLQKSE
jgi:23S rRNA (guanosine2251-2'-O)-methyltransferase